MRAAIYARTATPGHGVLARQLDECAELVDREGWELVDTFADTGSAFGTREGFDRLVELTHEGAVDVVVVWSVDRLARSLADLDRLAVDVSVVEVTR